MKVLALILSFGLASLYAAPDVVEKVYATPIQAIQKTYGVESTSFVQDVTLTPEQVMALESSVNLELVQTSLKLHTVKSNSHVAGYAVEINEIGKYYPITAMVMISPDHKVQDVHVLIYREKIGKEVRKRRFLKQFVGKTGHDPLRLDRDIDGISGATMSSWAMATAVKRALRLSDFIDTLITDAQISQN